MNIVITGTSRGIGLELTTLALAKSHHVIAVVRHPEKSEALQALKKKYQGHLQFCEVDLRSENLTQELKNKTTSWSHIDILINNAGVFRKDETLNDFIESFQVNSVVPFFVTKALLPLLKKSTEPKVAHITSLMGSIQDNNSGGYYSYRSSKAALNMINKSLTIDHPELCSIVIHPGWVQTDMGGQQAPLKPKDSAEGIWSVIETSNKAQSGQFFDYSGKQLPW